MDVGEDEDGSAECPSAPSDDAVGTTDGLGGAALLDDVGVLEVLETVNGPVGGIDG